MYLREMRRLTNLFVFSFFSLSILAQSNSFRSGLNNFSDSSLYIDSLRSMMNLEVLPRVFGATSLSKDDNSNAFLLGISLRAQINDKLKIVGSYDYLEGNHHNQIKSYKDSLNIYFPGYGLANSRYLFNTTYRASKFISIDLGNGKQFVGDGYQSLLLSDVASAYPYLKISTKFGPVKYYNLYTTFINPDVADYGRKKHATTHYLNFAVTPNIHFGVFESILWQSKSEEVYKGYEFAYLNPVIFYRPVEFSKYSNKGNALIGANFNIKLYSNLFYGQLMLDDLNISRQKDNDENYQSGFFQNKYGFQLGFKGNFNNLSYLFEYNQVQPYTYGHRTILQNYSHMNQALAHPLGANFKEAIGIIEYKKNNWNYRLKSLFAFAGLDSLGTHYGQDIFQSDNDASTGGQYSYGNYNGQGFGTVIISLDAEVVLQLESVDIFGVISLRNKKSDLLDQTSIYYSLGIRNFPFTNFFDY